MSHITNTGIFCLWRTCSISCPNVIVSPKKNVIKNHQKKSKWLEVDYYERYSAAYSIYSRPSNQTGWNFIQWMSFRGNHTPQQQPAIADAIIKIRFVYCNLFFVINCNNFVLIKILSFCHF